MFVFFIWILHYEMDSIVSHFKIIERKNLHIVLFAQADFLEKAYDTIQALTIMILGEIIRVKA